MERVEFRVSNFPFFYFFASKRNAAKQKPFDSLFALFRETKKIMFRVFSLRFTYIFFASFRLTFWHPICLLRFASFCFDLRHSLDSNFSFFVGESNLRWLGVAFVVVSK